MQDFFPKTEQQFPLDEEHSITLRKLTYGDMANASGIAVARAEQHQGDNAAMLIYLRSEVMLRSLEAWAGPQLDNLPCTRKNIRALSLDIGSKIEAIAWKFNGESGEEEELEKKESSDTTSS